jgi:hypothetical protein
VVDFFVNTIKNVVGSKKATASSDENIHQQNASETTKGIDIKLKNNINFLPSFGNNKDLKFIFLGKQFYNFI